MAQVNYPYGASLKDAENKLSYDLFYIKTFFIYRSNHFHENN